MTPRHHVYLVPGFFGFGNLGEIRYFAHVLDFLPTCFDAIGFPVELHVVETQPTASLPRRAARVLETIAATIGPRGAPVHLIGHSSGGVDVRLMVAPSASLPTDLDVERFARSVRTVVSVSTPHHGTPVASFFASLLGQRLLQVLSLSTMSALRFGRLPLSILLPLGAAFARIDERVGLNSALLDELFGRLLENFSPERRDAVEAFVAAVGKDQALLPQLSPEGMEVFNAATRDRPGVLYASVVTRARPPGVFSTLSAGLDPTAQASHAVYQALYRLASRLPPGLPLEPSTEHARVLRRAYTAVPSPAANDGVVPTRSQPWGEIIQAVQADHLDVIGHFADPSHVPPHVDWLSTGSGFTRKGFEEVWSDVARYILRAEERRWSLRDFKVLRRERSPAD